MAGLEGWRQVPRWTRGGREIVYLQRAAGTGQGNLFTVMAVPVSDDGMALSSGLPRALFTADFNRGQEAIFTGGRPLPEDPVPTFNGYSTGRWDGD